MSKYFLLILTLALSIFVRAATFAQRNMPHLAEQISSVGTSSAALPFKPVKVPSPADQPVKRGPVSFEKILVQFVKVQEIIPYPHWIAYVFPSILSPVSYIGTTPSRPPSA